MKSGGFGSVGHSARVTANVKTGPFPTVPKIRGHGSLRENGPNRTKALLGSDVNPVTLANVETHPRQRRPRAARVPTDALQQTLEDTTMATDLIVSTQWLAEHMSDPTVRVVDMRGSVVTTQVSPGVEQADYRGARDEYLAAHIPGAVYIDWTKDIIDPDDPVPVQIAPPARFAEAMAVRGIGDETLVIAVDHAGGQFATRLWWALNYYGHDNVRVLDGGWNKWIKEGRSVEAGEVTVPRLNSRQRLGQSSV